MPHDRSRRIFEAWAPPDAPWSDWAKPVVFQYIPDELTASVPWDGDRSLLPHAGERLAVVVDLPGVDSVRCGLALARRGFAPVPLYNCTRGEGRELVRIESIVQALSVGAAELSEAPRSPESPPAFLIDSSRLEGDPVPETFDNRWMVFPQDFPSARRLLAGGISQVLVVRMDDHLRPDLRAVLRLWQRGGIECQLLRLPDGRRTSMRLELSLVAILQDHLRSIWHGLSENATGGFGARVPDPGSSSGFA